MLLIGCILVIVFGSAKADNGATGYLSYASDVVNLDSNLTSYTVGCTVTSSGIVGVEASSQNLQIINAQRIPYATEIANDTTVIHKVDLQNSDEASVCGVKSYVCRWHKSFIGMHTIYVARPPPLIKSSDLKCISYNRNRLVCQFKRQNSCGLNTIYYLSMIRLNLSSKCNLNDSGRDWLSFDSRMESCTFSSGHKSITFEIKGENKIGETISTHVVDHYDIVKPEQPGNLQVSFLGVTRVNITWSMHYMLNNLERLCEIEFSLITKYDTKQSFINITLENIKGKILEHQFTDLYAFTKYELKMRARIVPKHKRYFEDEYWSEWSSVQFLTNATKPYEPPRLLPGGYTFKEKRDDHMAIEIYWEQIPENRHNGPGFGCGIYAISQSGHTLSSNATNSGVATFYKAKLNESYTVYLSSYNEEGRSEDLSTMQVYTPRAVYQPKIKRMFFDQQINLLQWFPIDDMIILSNYTVMYCNYTTTGSCQNPVTFDTVPASATSYFLNSTQLVTIAVAANYHSYSSELSWPECAVSPTSSINQLNFTLTDKTEHSFTVRLHLSCMDKFLIERYNVRYWPKLSPEEVKTQTYQPYETVIPIDDLLTDTEYEVIVTGYDEKDNFFEAKSVVRTKSKDILVPLILFLLFGLLIMSIMTTTATRRVKKMMNIKVEIPIGLLGIDEMPIKQEKSLHELQHFSDDPDYGIELKVLPSIEHQSFAKIMGSGYPETTDDELCDNIYFEEPPPNPYLPMQVTVKSILKKSDQPVELPSQTNRPKANVHIVTSSDYIKPAQMPCMTVPAKPVALCEANRSSGGSSGYVDVNLMIKQHQMIR